MAVFMNQRLTVRVLVLLVLTLAGTYWLRPMSTASTRRVRIPRHKAFRHGMPAQSECRVQENFCEKVKKFRGALPRPFVNWRLDVVASFLFAGGYCGQAHSASTPPIFRKLWDCAYPRRQACLLPADLVNSLAGEQHSIHQQYMCVKCSSNFFRETICRTTTRRYFI